MRYLDLSNNELKDINALLQDKSLNYLETLKCSYNQIPSQYLEDFCFILTSLPNLLEVDNCGNELVLNSLYKSAILSAKKLKILDGYEIDENTIKQI